MSNFFRSIKSLGVREGLSVYFKLKNKRITKIKLSSLETDIHLRGGTSDIPTFKKIFIKREYELALDFQPRFIIDAGAYIGLSALFFTTEYPGARIISIEPQRNNYSILKENTAGYKNIYCMNTALWYESKLFEVIDKGHGHWGYMVEEVSEPRQGTIASTSIKKIMQGFNVDQIDILKIDVEGAEKEIFSTNYDEWLPKTRVIIIELHDHMKNECSESFYNAISKYHFKSYLQGENVIAVNQQLI